MSDTADGMAAVVNLLLRDVVQEFRNAKEQTLLQDRTARLVEDAIGSPVPRFVKELPTEDDEPTLEVLILGTRLVTIRPTSPSNFEVAYLNLRGGSYVEQVRLQSENVERRIVCYKHARLRSPLRFEVDPRTDDGKRYDNELRPLLVMWSTSDERTVPRPARRARP